MLPFRSGRAGFSGAPSVLLCLVFLCCAAFADQKETQGKVEGGAKSGGRPHSSEGLTDIPIAPGHDAKGLILPDYDLEGHLRGKLEAGITRRLDQDRVEFKDVKLTTFIPEQDTPDLEIIMTTSVFNLRTQVLDSSERTTVKRSDFEISGDRMQFEMLTRKGTLAGNVKMVVRGKVQTRGNEHE